MVLLFVMDFALSAICGFSPIGLSESMRLESEGSLAGFVPGVSVGASFEGLI